MGIGLTQAMGRMTQPLAKLWKVGVLVGAKMPQAWIHCVTFNRDGHCGWLKSWPFNGVFPVFPEKSNPPEYHCQSCFYRSYSLVLGCFSIERSRALDGTEE